MAPSPTPWLLSALFSAIRTFIVPRGLPSRLTRAVFTAMRLFFVPLLSERRPATREQALAFFAPVTLLALPVVWLAFLLVGYTAIYRALGASSWATAFTISRLSLLYLGSNIESLPGSPVFAFSETVLSLLLAAILVSYLPTMYAAFSQREAVVTGLETRAGSPPTPLAMLRRYHLIHGLDPISEIWTEWQAWFEGVEESHPALLPLVFYRSPQPDRSWVTAAGAVLDTAAIAASALDRPRDPQAELCIRAGYLCLRRIARLFGIPCNADPSPTDPISITRSEFDDLYDALAEVGAPPKPDRDHAWRDFAGWRVNYDVPLVALAALTWAPPAPGRRIGCQSGDGPFSGRSPGRARWRWPSRQGAHSPSLTIPLWRLLAVNTRGAVETTRQHSSPTVRHPDQARNDCRGRRRVISGRVAGGVGHTVSPAGDAMLAKFRAADW